MKVIIPRNLKEAELGKRKTEEFVHKSYYTSKLDNQIYDFPSETITYFGTLRKIGRNKQIVPPYKYTYIYEYISQNRNPKKPEDLQKMIIELLSIFNVHEFKTDIQGADITNRIEDYYLQTTANMNYSGSQKASCKFENKSKLIAQSIARKDSSLKYDSIESAKLTLNSPLSKEEFIASFFMFRGINKEYNINLSLDKIGNGQTIDEFRDTLLLDLPKTYPTLDEAIEAGVISIEDIISYLEKNKITQGFIAYKISDTLLDKILDENRELLSSFYEGTIPVHILKKYNPNFINGNLDIEDELLDQIKELGFTLFYDRSTIRDELSKLALHTGKYTEKFDVDTYGYDKLKKYVLEAIREQETKKQQADLEIIKNKAKQMGYPDNFEYFHVPGLGVNAANAFVIESDGKIREADYYTDKGRAKGYNQIFPGEIIVTYYKLYVSKPYLFTVEWADGDITKAQFDALEHELKRELQEQATFAQDGFYGPEITDLEQWAINAVKTKAEECKKQLKVENKLESDSKSPEQIARLSKEMQLTTKEIGQAAILLKENEKEKKMNSKND